LDKNHEEMISKDLNLSKTKLKLTACNQLIINQQKKIKGLEEQVEQMVDKEIGIVKYIIYLIRVEK